MNNLTAARDISGIAPIGVLRGISPLCVPYVPGAGIADEVRHRADPRIVSLWERLGLVYLFDQPAAVPVNRTHVTVNNFTAELAFRICSQNHTDRLIERYQPGFVFPENIQSAGRSYETIVRRTELRRVGEMFGRNSRYTEEVSRIFRLVFEKETGGIPLQTVCRALAALLGSTGGGAVFTSQQQMIFQRIAKVLSDEYPESTAAQEVASVGAAAVFTEEQRRRILSAANVMGYRSQHDAAQRVLSLVNSGRTREEIGRVLLTEVRRYGLEENAADNLRAAGKITPFSAVIPESAPEGSSAVGVAVPEISTLREVTRLIFAEESHADAPEREVTAAEISEGSAARLISERLSSIVERNAGYREISGQLTRLVERLGGNSDEVRTNPGSTVVQKFSGAPVANFISVTAGTSGRLLKQFGGSGQGQLQVLRTPEQTPQDFSENVRNTLNIMQQYSAGNSVEMSYPATEFDLTENTNVSVNGQTGSEVRTVSPGNSSGSQLTVQSEKFNNSEKIVEKNNASEVHSGTVVQAEHPVELHSAEQFHTETVREPDGGNAPQAAEKPGRVVPVENTVELHSAEHFYTETVREPDGGNAPQAAEKPGRVVPGESSVELRSAEHFYTETVQEPDGGNAPQAAEKPGRVVAGESSVEFYSAEQFHTETVQEPDGGNASQAAEKPGRVVPGENTVELHSAEQFHTETVREPDGGNAPQAAEKPGRVVTGESSVEFHSAEQFHTETVREPDGGNAPQTAERPGRVVPGENTVELRSAEHFYTETVREPDGGNAPQAAEKPGRVVPGESSVEFHSAEQFHTETVQERTEEQAAGSYRSRLDKKTLETLDRLVAESRSQTVKPLEVREEPVTLVHSESVTAEAPAGPVNINADSLRNVSIVRRSIVNETSLHMKKLMEKAAGTATVQPAVKKAFTYRTADKTGDMVMLIPPAEADRFRASGAFDRKLPPIELRQPPEPQPERESTTRKTTINNRPVIRTSETGIGELSRDDITKLADKVYEQIETRLTRERRRMGL